MQFIFYRKDSVSKSLTHTMFAELMMLAFLVDQVQQLACELFQAVLEKKGSRKRLWEHMRALFKTIEFKSMAQLFKAILYGYKATVVIFSPL